MTGAWLSTADAAERLQTTLSWVQKAAAAGRLAAHRDGGTWSIFFDEEDRCYLRTDRPGTIRGNLRVVYVGLSTVDWPTEVQAALVARAARPRAVTPAVLDDLEEQLAEARAEATALREQLARQNQRNQFILRDAFDALAETQAGLAQAQAGMAASSAALTKTMQSIAVLLPAADLPDRMALELRL